MPNKIYKIDETTVIFGDEVGDDIVWTTANIGNGAGRQSNQKDWGAGGTARSRRHMYRAACQWVATPTVGAQCRFYLKRSDGTYIDNDDGTGDLAVSAEDKLKNLLFLKSVICDEAAANIPSATGGEVTFNERYTQAVLWNGAAVNLRNADTATKLLVTPVPSEIQ